VKVAKEDGADITGVELSAFDLQDGRCARALGAEADEGAILRVQLGVEPDSARTLRRQLSFNQRDVVVVPAGDDQDGPKGVLMAAQRAWGSLTGSNSVAVPTYWAAASAATGRRLPNSNGVVTVELL